MQKQQKNIGRGVTSFKGKIMPKKVPPTPIPAERGAAIREKMIALGLIAPPKEPAKTPLHVGVEWDKTMRMPRPVDATK